MKSLNKIVLSLIAMISISANSQEFDANLQFRPRYEYRNGFKTLISNGESPTSFVSQRSRLNFNFKQEKIKIKLTLQNIRTWGDVSTTSTADKNGVALFEAWAQYEFNSKFSLKPKFFTRVYC